jgi:glycosyltransferase involved in cell wall biosynthesis
MAQSSNSPAGRRIVVMTAGNPCYNPRPVKEADALGRAGHDVTLLTMAAAGGAREADRELTQGAPYRHEWVFWGLTAASSLRSRTRVWLARKAARAGFETRHSLGVIGPLERRAFAMKADLFIVHTEIPFWIGTRLMRAGRRVAADFEDWHSEDLLPQDRRNRPLRLLRGIEKALVNGAAYTSTTSASLSNALSGRYGGPLPLAIANAFPLQAAPRTAFRGPVPSILWFSQTVGPGRGLEAFVAGWALVGRPSRLVLLGAVSDKTRADLLHLVPENLRERVSFVPAVSPLQLPSFIAGHDVGLALEDPSIPNRDLTITNKILQYMNAGLAIIASDTAGQREALSFAPGAGVVCNTGDAPRLAAEIDSLIGNPARMDAMGRASRRAAEMKYCWEKQAPLLLERVAAVLAGPAP